MRWLRLGASVGRGWPGVRQLSAVLLCAVTGLAGCQAYERRPLDMSATRAAWDSRSPTDPSVREFAAALDRSDGGSRGVVFDPADGLTLPEAEVVALVFNPDLRLARLETGVTRAAAAHAGLWQDPVLGVDFERIVSGAADGGGANAWVAGSAVGITIPISGRLEAEKARAGAEVAADLGRLAAKEWATRAALQERWVEWSAAMMRVEMSERLLGRLRDVVALADLQEQAGSMTRVDARLFRVELAGREADLLANAARVKELELQLRAMLGLSPRAAITLVPCVAIEARLTDPLELQRVIEASNPELAAIRAEYELSEASLRAEVRKQYPDLTIGPGLATDQGDSRVLLGLSLPIPLWNRNQQGVWRAAASREAARGRFETTYERVSAQLTIALVVFEAGRSQRALIEARVVPLAEEQEADVARVSALGRVDPLLVLDSVKTRHAAKVRLLEARVAESIGAIRINELIGPAHLASEAAAASAARSTPHSPSGSTTPFKTSAPSIAPDSMPGPSSEGHRP